MTVTQQQDAGLAQRGLLLLGGMTLLAAVVLVIVLRRSEAPAKAESSEALLVPLVMPGAAYPATPGWPVVVKLSQDLPSAPGWEIRYNAALALARRGSTQVPWALIHEMLDEERQRRNFRVKLKSGQEVADEEDASRTVANALAAVAQWHKKQPAVQAGTVPPDLQRVYEQIDRLAQHGSTPLRVQADRVRQSFQR